MKKLFFCAFSLCILGIHAQNLTTDLVVCMPMNNNANDFSGNSNNGTVMGGATLGNDRFSNSNSAYYFNAPSSQYINIPVSSSINNIEVTDELSICIWANVTAFSVPSNNNLFPLVEKYNNTTSDNGWSFALTGGGITATDISFVINGPVASPLAVNSVASGSAIPLGSWHFYAMTFSKSNNLYRLWMDGALITSSTLPSGTQLENTSGSIRIGFSEAGPTEYAHGAMDDLRIYNRELDPTEIYALYTQTNIACSTTTFVIEPPQPESCCLGNKCSDSKNALSADYEIPLDKYNFSFTDDNMPYQQKVNVGIPCGTMFPGKFNVTTAFQSDANSNGDSYSIYATNTNGGDGTFRTGVYGSAINSTYGVNRGLWGYASSQANAQGVFGKGGRATNSYGGYFESIDGGNNTNYGIYARASGATGLNWAGYFQGNVQINGTLWVNATAYTSDRRFKKNIKPLEDINQKIMKITGYSYNFKPEEFKERNFDERTHLGFIAQELKEVFPELVLEDEKGMLGVDYQAMIPVLLEAIKGEQKQIDELKAQVVALTGTSGKSTTGTPVILSDKNAVVLNQNVPNPFAETTVITYNLPADFTKAQIIFTDNSGVIIKTVDIREKGPGTLNIFANDLTHGLYTYTLVVDGKTIDSKKMVKE